MTKRNAAWMAGLAGAALLLWLASRAPEGELGPGLASPAAVAREPRLVDVRRAEGEPQAGPLGQPAVPSDARASASATDAGVPRTSADANELAALVRAYDDASVRARLERNARRAAAEIDRYCELSDKLKKQPLFPETPGTRDAAVFLSSRVDWEGRPDRYGSLHLSPVVSERVRGEWLTTVTDTDLAGLDFGWMKQLLAFDVWTFSGDGAAEELTYSAIASNIPNFRSLQTHSKLRFSRALRDGDWNDAVREVRHLAYLMHTLSLAVSEALSFSLLRIEVRAREQAARLGVDLSSLPPLPDATLLLAHRDTSVKTGWFVAPGVPEAVRRRALECSAVKCTTVLEGLSLHSSLRPWAAPGSMESFLGDVRGMGYEPSLVARLPRMPPATLDELKWLMDDAEETTILPATDGGR